MTDPLSTIRKIADELEAELPMPLVVASLRAQCDALEADAEAYVYRMAVAKLERWAAE